MLDSTAECNNNPGRQETSQEASSIRLLELLRSPVVDSNVARVTVVVGAVASLVVATWVQDRLCCVTDGLAVDLVFTSTVSGIDHVAVSDGELSPVAVGWTLVDPANSLLAVGNAGRIAGALAALGVIVVSKFDWNRMSQLTCWRSPGCQPQGVRRWWW